MDRYLEVTTIHEIDDADRSCDLLEQAGIPVIIRHVEISSEQGSFPGYMLLVPTQYSNQAHSLVGTPT